MLLAENWPGVAIFLQGTFSKVWFYDYNRLTTTTINISILFLYSSHFISSHWTFLSISLFSTNINFIVWVQAKFTIKTACMKLIKSTENIAFLLYPILMFVRGSLSTLSRFLSLHDTPLYESYCCQNMKHDENISRNFSPILLFWL